MKKTRSRILSADEEKILFNRYLDEGDDRARNDLIMAYKPLAVKAATAFAKRGVVDLHDLCQEAYIALAHAIDKFDRTKEVRLSTFAAFYIRAALVKYVMDNCGVVRVGTNFADKKVFSNLRRMVAEIERRTGSPLTDAGRQEIADNLSVNLTVVRRMEARVFDSDISVASISSSDEDDAAATSHVPDGMIVQSASVVSDATMDKSRVMSKIVSSVHDTYSGRDLEIVMARIQGDMTPERYAALVSRHGITVERIRQIQRGALAQIRLALLDEGIDGMHAISA